MCGHGTIGTVTALIETGLMRATEPVTEVVWRLQQDSSAQKQKLKTEK